MQSLRSHGPAVLQRRCPRRGDHDPVRHFGHALPGLQADPFVEDTGTLNRYTYVHNNPLVFTDPSGYFSFKKWGRIVASIAISVYSGGSVQGASWGLWGSSVSSLQAVATVAVGGAVSGAISSGTWEGAYYGAFSSLAFYNVGQELASAAWARGSGASGLSAAGLAAKTVSHGLIGGAVAHAQGGKFGHGFLSSGVTAASTPYIATRFDGNRFAQGALASMVGGTVSSATGGKFANGAVTAAMAFAFNELASSGEHGEEEDQLRDRYYALGRELEDRARDNPEGVLDMSAEELAVIVDWMNVRANRQPRHSFLGDEFKRQFRSFDTFLWNSPLLTGRQFNVAGHVVAEGGHINYVGVGLLAAHYGPNVEQMIPVMVAGHNLGQIADARGFGNLRDIGPGTRWALVGAASYRRRP